MNDKPQDNFFAQIQDEGVHLIDSPVHYRRALGYHLLLIADALHDVEWVDKGHLNPGDDEEAVRIVIEPADILIQAMEMSKQAAEVLQYEMQKAQDFLNE